MNKKTALTVGVASIATGIGGYLLGKVVLPPNDIAKHQERVILTNETAEGLLHLMPKPIYTYKFMGYRYGCLYLYTTPQGDVNAIVDVSLFIETGKYQAEVARVCADPLRVYIDGNLLTTFPLATTEKTEEGYFTHIF